MRTATYQLKDLENLVFYMGYVGENEHRALRVDCSEAYDEYPDAIPSLSVAPPRGEPYPVILTTDGNYVLWVITDSDLAYDGSGEAQFSFVQDEVVMKTYRFKTKVDKSVMGTGSAPAPLDDFITRAEEVLGEVEESIPAGGTTGQVLAKKTDDDRDLEWIDPLNSYNALENKPQVGGVELIGNKSLHDLGIASENEVNIVKSAFNNSTGNEILEGWVVGKRLATNGDSVNFNSPSSSSTSAYQVVDCQEGDVFTLTGKGTHSTYRLWCWCETDGTIVSRPSSNLDYNCVEITCPENATKLVVNVNTLNPYQLINGKLLEKRVNAELDLLEGNTTLDLSTATEANYIINSENQWASSSTAKSATIPIINGTRKIDITAGENNGVVAFLKDIINMSGGNTPNFATGHSGRIKVTAGKTISFEIGADAAYLYFGKLSTSGTDQAISSAVCSADVLRVKDEERLIDRISESITNIMPTLYEGWFDWTLKFSYTAQGGTNSSNGYATTKPIAVAPGNQIVNISSATNADEVATGLFIVEFNGTTFDRRVKVEVGERYIVPDDIDNIRIMFGFASASGITITKPMLSEYFAVKMMTAAEQNDFETPVYVAYGASTTIGAVHRFTGQGTYYSAYSFPDYIGRALNLKTYNHGHGSTGFLARSDGTVPNFMDAIYADDDLLKTASLVTIIFGYGNDRSAGLPIGKYTDYYPYDADGYHPSGTAGITEMLAKGATLMGCLNWCIKWISEHYPTITLVVISGSPSMNGDRTITMEENPDSTGSNGRPPYILSIVDPYSDTGIVDPDDAYNLPTSKQGAAQIRVELPKLQKALGIPIVNMIDEGNNINFWNAYAKNEDGKYSIFSTVGTADDQTSWAWNSHPNDAGYKMYAQYLAGKVIALYKH